MREGIHPEIEKIVIEDTTKNEKFILSMDVSAFADKLEAPIDYKGEKLRVLRLSVTSKSHPLWTGEQKLLDTRGKLAKFAQKYERGPVKKVEPAPTKPVRKTKK